MKKLGKFAATVAVVASLFALVSFIHDYHQMKKMEEKLDKLPLHRFRRRMSHVSKEGNKTVIEMTNHGGILDKARICAKVLMAK